MKRRVFGRSEIALSMLLCAAIGAAQNASGTGPGNGTGTPNLPTGYTIQALSPVGGGTSFGMGLNANGVAVGWGQMGPGERGFQWSAGTGMTLLDPAAGASGSHARSVSTNGTISGWNVFSSNQATLWTTPSQQSSRLSVSSFFYDVNDSGKSVGWTQDAAGSRGFVATGGTISYLSTLAGDTNSQAYALNTAGIVVGCSLSAASQQAVRWTRTGTESLGTLTGGNYSTAFDISDNGYIVGHSGSTAGQRAFRWQNGTMIDLGVLNGDASSTAFGVNSYGWAVGRSTSAAGVRHGYLHSGTNMLSLQSMIADPQAATSWNIWDAQAINDSGQIVGTGLFNGVNTAYIMTPTTPVPEPTTMLAIGVGLISLRRRSRR